MTKKIVFQPKHNKSSWFLVPSVAGTSYPSTTSMLFKYLQRYLRMIYFTFLGLILWHAE